MARGDDGELDAGPVVERIRNSRYIRIPGDDYWGMFLSPEIVEEIERFTDTLEQKPEPETVLATILFTDLVGSSERASLATVNGPSYSPVTTPRSDNSSDGSAAARSTPRATGSLRASMDRLGRSAALAPSPSWCASSASKCASVSTPASAKSSPGSRRESPSTPERESLPPPPRAKCS
jgi:hypothetical protein